MRKHAIPTPRAALAPTPRLTSLLMVSTQPGPTEFARVYAPLLEPVRDGVPTHLTAGRRKCLNWCGKSAPACSEWEACRRCLTFLTVRFSQH